MVLRTLQNPRYAGIYCYGKTRQHRNAEGGYVARSGRCKIGTPGFQTPTKATYPRRNMRRISGVLPRMRKRSERAGVAPLVKARPFSRDSCCVADVVGE
jgi:hypothetical protein